MGLKYPSQPCLELFVQEIMAFVTKQR